MLTKKNFFDKLGRANQTHFSMNNPQPEPQKVYVTGYALTSGVFLVEAEISECGRFARAKNQFGLNTAYTLGKSAFFSVEEAKAIFEKRKASAIRSAKKKLQKLENLEFSFKEC